MVKNQPARAGDPGDAGLIPGSGRSPKQKMATHSSIVAWKIPQGVEPGGGRKSVRYDSAAEHACNLDKFNIFVPLQNRGE